MEGERDGSTIEGETNNENLSDAYRSRRSGHRSLRRNLPDPMHTDRQHHYMPDILLLMTGLVDDKVVTARRLLREGASLRQMAKPLGYTSPGGVAHYLKSMGLPVPSIRGKSHKPPQSDAINQRRSEKMKAWHATHELYAERGNKEL